MKPPAELQPTFNEIARTVTSLSVARHEGVRICAPGVSHYVHYPSWRPYPRVGTEAVHVAVPVDEAARHTLKLLFDISTRQVIDYNVQATNDDGRFTSPELSPQEVASQALEVVRDWQVSEAES